MHNPSSFSSFASVNHFRVFGFVPWRLIAGFAKSAALWSIAGMSAEDEENAKRKKCPSCKTEIYNRAERHCRVCGFNLPAEFLLSEAEIRSHEAKIDQIRRKNFAKEVPDPGMPVIPPDEFPHLPS